MSCENTCTRKSLSDISCCSHLPGDDCLNHSCCTCCNCPLIIFQYNTYKRLSLSYQHQSNTKILLSLEDFKKLSDNQRFSIISDLNRLNVNSGLSALKFC